MPCENNIGHGVCGPKSPANTEGVQGVSMSIDLEKGEVVTGKVVKQQCADMVGPSEVLSIAFNEEAKVELALWEGQRSTPVAEKVSTPMERHVGSVKEGQLGQTNILDEQKYGHAIEEIYGVGATAHIGEGKFDSPSHGTFDTVTKAYSDKAEVYATRDSDLVGAHKVNNTTERDGVKMGTKMGHVGVLDEKGVLQLLPDGDRMTQSKWKKIWKIFSHANRDGRKNHKRCDVWKQKGKR